MKAEQVYSILRRAADVTGWTEFVVIGSQAIHGTIENPDIREVIRSNDVDIYPKGGYGANNAMWETVLVELGQDSDYHLETDTYVEAVPPTLARLPCGWLDRAIIKNIGSIGFGNGRRPINLYFPEIHDLVVSKIMIGVHREKDRAFLNAVVRLGLVNRETLEERLGSTSLPDPFIKHTAIRRIEAAFP